MISLYFVINVNDGDEVFLFIDFLKCSIRNSLSQATASCIFSASILPSSSDSDDSQLAFGFCVIAHSYRQRCLTHLEVVRLVWHLLFLYQMEINWAGPRWFFFEIMTPLLSLQMHLVLSFINWIMFTYFLYLLFLKETIFFRLFWLCCQWDSLWNGNHKCYTNEKMFRFSVYFLFSCEFIFLLIVFGSFFCF